MIIDHVNLNHIRIFECVFRTKSMTHAATELHLTQSGVSQHIKSLEDMLGVKLFDRIKQKLVPTSSGRVLFEKCSQGLSVIEKALWTVKGADNQLSGIVSIGMPIEFGNNLVLPILAQLSKKHPLVHFKIKLGFASAMNDMLLDGSLDFAFIDDFKVNSRIKIEKVFDEVLELCASEVYMKKKPASKNVRAYYECLEYVEYQDEEPVLRMWFLHHLGSRLLDLTVRATIMDVQGIARLIQSDVGAGILPHHLLMKLQKDGHKIYRFKGCGKPLKNTISAAYLSERTQTPTVLAVLDSLRESFGAKASA